MRCSTVVPAAVLCLTVAAFAETSPFDRPLEKDKQAAHVLYRLTYGPLPGEIAQVRRVGVTRWIQQQLRPESIALPLTLQARLQPMESLTLATWQAFERYAPPAAAPAVPALAQLSAQPNVSKLISGTTEEKRAALATLTPAVRTEVLGVLPATALAALPEVQEEAARARAAVMQARQAEQRRLRPPLADLLTPEQVRVVQSGPIPERVALLQSLPRETRMHVLRQMPAQQVPEAFQREAAVARQPQQAVVNEVIESKLLRARYSPRQLEEVLVDFWLNHFNVSIDKGSVRMMVASYERDAIRPHVLGRFRDMLLATARHPAMLFYLDNWQSRAAPDPDRVNGQKPVLNENYGRELLELHTLGVDGGYTQDDVVAVSRAFTGWTIFEPNRYGEFQFNPSMHDRGEKKVLGHTISRGGGEEDGVKVIDILAAHPSTARFISRKLAQRFVADDPPAALVARMAVTFQRTGGDLRAVMETMLGSREFLSQGAWQAKVKSPLEYVMSALRALDADVTDTTMLAQRLTAFGQPLYAKAEPTGYPNTGEGWSSSAAILARIDFATALTNGQVRGVRVDTLPGLLREPRPTDTPRGELRPTDTPRGEPRPTDKPGLLREPRSTSPARDPRPAAADLHRAFTATMGVEPPAARRAEWERAAADTVLSSADVATIVLASPDFQKR